MGDKAKHENTFNLIGVDNYDAYAAQICDNRGGS